MSLKSGYFSKGQTGSVNSLKISFKKFAISFGLSMNFVKIEKSPSYKWILNSSQEEIITKINEIIVNL